MVEELESRYTVIKHADLTDAPDEIIAALANINIWIDAKRRLAKKSPLDCVVIESGWPEFEPARKALLERINGAELPGEEHGQQYCGFTIPQMLAYLNTPDAAMRLELSGDGWRLWRDCDKFGEFEQEGKLFDVVKNAFSPFLSVAKANRERHQKYLKKSQDEGGDND